MNKRLMLGCVMLLSLMACESKSDFMIPEVEEPISDIEPVEEVEEPISDIEPVEEVEEPASDIEPVEEVEEPVSDIEPVEEAEEPVSDIKPVEEVKEPVPDIKPVEEVKEPDQDQQVNEGPLMNQTLVELNLTLGAEHMGAVIHNPLENQLNAVQAINYTVEPVEEGFLFVPKVIGTRIQIYEVMWQDDKLVSGDLLFEQKDLKDRESLYLQCPVPEGIPGLKVVIEDDEQRVDYVITYDGIGTRDQVELLTGEID